MNKHIPMVLVLTLAMVASSTAMAQGYLLRDDFDDGSIYTNTNGIGSGFVLNDLWSSPATGAWATESGGLATIGGPVTVKTLVSKDAFDPIGKILTWQIASRPAGPGNGADIGWNPPDGNGCCRQGINLAMTQGVLTFDISSDPVTHPGVLQISRYVRIPLGSTVPGSYYTNGTGPVTASIFLTATEWKIDVTGPGVDVHRRGPYSGCQIIFSHGKPCATPADVLANTGGTLNPHALASREWQSASFDSVTVTEPAPPAIVRTPRNFELWAPNHKFSTYRVSDFVACATDYAGNDVTSSVVISKVTSDEADSGSSIDLGDDCRSVQLQAERDGGGNGRVYTLTFSVRDDLGHVGTATAQVTVRHDQRKGAVVDDGVAYSVNGNCQ